MTQVREVMSSRGTIVDDDSNIEQVAEVLAEGDIGAVPERGAVVGHLMAMLTDLRIVVRLVATGLRGSPSRKSPPTTKSRLSGRTTRSRATENHQVQQGATGTFSSG